MAALVLFTALLLVMTGYSSATYCICKDGVADTILQKNIDYACGNGADCAAILSSGGCFQPNTVKAHCDYAVNNYYQKKSQVAMSCDFSGTATVTNALPSTVASSCTYASTPSQVTGSSTTSTPTTTTGTPTTSSSSSSTSSTTFGLGPTGSGIDSSYNSFAPHHANSLPLAAIAMLLGLLLVLWG